MKNHENIIIVLLTVLIVTFSFSGCEPDEVLDDIISECDAEENQMTPESIPFILGCYVKYMDGNPAESFAVKMTIWAEACEGDISDEDTSRNLSLTDVSGYWFSELYISYNYTNKKDVISAIFYITRDGFPDYFHTEVYRWEDVENEHPKYVTITLPYNVGEAPLADFTANETLIIVGQSIDFSDQSSNIPTSWEWDFGDGNTSAIQNPSHIYNDTGSYTISLKAANEFGSGIESKEDYILVSTVAPAPIADFYASETTIYRGQSITFYDQSSNSPTSWHWDFGDGNTSAVQQPSHSYDNSGSYTISLTVTNAAGSHTETKGDYIVVEEEPCVGFTYQGQTYDVVQVSNQCWMKENMNYETDNSYCYDDDPANCAIYGRLYTWEAALNVCPPGWHLPSSGEWSYLSGQLGGHTVAGGKLKEEGTMHWDSPNAATNESGFFALPGGYRSTTYRYLGDWGHWWTTSLSTVDEMAKYRSITHTYKYLYNREHLKSCALSVRCLRD